MWVVFQAYGCLDSTTCCVTPDLEKPAASAKGAADINGCFRWARLYVFSQTAN